MRLNFSPALQINNAFQSYQINRSAANKPGVNEAEGSNEERRDTFTLSPAGKTQNLINSLMKQKMDITDRKNALLASVKEQGGSMESIKTQLEAYDEQLQNIDIQISEAMSRELEKQEEEKKAGDEEPKTKEEILTERMNAVTSMSTDAERIDSLDSIKTRVDGRVKVLESELALDEDPGGGPVREIVKRTQTRETVGRKLPLPHARFVAAETPGIFAHRSAFIEYFYLRKRPHALRKP